MKKKKNYPPFPKIFLLLVLLIHSRSLYLLSLTLGVPIFFPCKVLNWKLFIFLYSSLPINQDQVSIISCLIHWIPKVLFYSTGLLSSEFILLNFIILLKFFFSILLKLNVNFQLSPWHSLRTLVPTVFFPLFILKAFTIPLDDLTSKFHSSMTYLILISSAQSSISVVTPGMVLHPKPESALRTTCFSACPTIYSLWIYPSTFQRPLIHQPS